MANSKPESALVQLGLIPQRKKNFLSEPTSATNASTNLPTSLKVHREGPARKPRLTTRDLRSMYVGDTDSVGEGGARSWTRWNTDWTYSLSKEEVSDNNRLTIDNFLSPQHTLRSAR